MNAVWKRVSESGHLELPEDIRTALGVEHGGRVMIEQTGGEIHLRSVAEVVARVQALTRALVGDHTEISSDALIAERRREASRD
jgi:bifunctional DNA-binding transcriptional regulator/antitoxin component of YhaV-PrlF toxin-antitoxin module